MDFSLRICIFSLFVACALALAGCGKSNVSAPEVYSTSNVSVPEEYSTSPKPRISGSYTVWGKEYKTLASADGFIQYGKASWYGKDFHGRKTANGERYDMYGMTAAHKNLPFGTMLRVTNLTNNKTVVVRVNDRGPFVKGRVIDVTHTAARKLGMLGPGVVRVKIETIGGSGGRITANKRSFSGTYYVQVGSFGSKKNAQLLRQKVMQAGRSCRLFRDNSSSVWKVQVGPYFKYVAAERAKDSLNDEFSGAFVFAAN